jgi:hypothetical protein
MLNWISGLYGQKFSSRDEARQWVEDNYPERLVPGRISIEAYNKYGYLNWHSWNIAHWGTKWEAYSVSLEEIFDDLLIYTFETAWAIPEMVIVKLISDFKLLAFKHKYFDEGGNFWGSAFYAGGMLISERRSLKGDRNVLHKELYGYDLEDETNADC